MKDMEDIEGDMKYGCKTLPIVSGLRTTKMYAMVWLVVLMAAIVVLQLYVLLIGWWLAAVYLFALVLIPLFFIAKKLLKAQAASDFGVVSKWTKWVMLTGILSMIFFRIYFS